MRQHFTRSLNFLLFVCLLFLTAFAQAQNTDLPNPTANIQKVPAGTYVIAMDNTLQSNPGYFNVKAYGLVVKILNNRKAVCWAIRSGKSKDDIDFSAPATQIFPTSSASSLRNFKAGPFLVLPRDSNGVAAVISAFNAGLAAADKVNVYQLTSDVMVDIRYILTQIPRVAILNDGSNSAVHAKYFSFASIDSVTNWRITAAVNLDDSCYTFASEPHSDKVGPTIDSIRAYVMNGGNFLAQCRAVNTYENELNGRFQTNNGILIRNLNTSPNYSYPNPDLSFSQYEGRFDPIVIGGSERNWITASGSSYINNTHFHQTGDLVADSNLAGQTVAKLAPGTGHLVFYTGGHDYAKSLTGDFINGMRSYFNAMLTPSGVTKCNFLRFDNDLAVTKTGDSAVCVGSSAFFTIVVTNNGPMATNSANVLLQEIFPSNGFSIVSATPSKGTYDLVANEWSVGPMSYMESDTLVIEATAILPGYYENKVQIVRDEHDYDQTNDTAAVSIFVSELDASVNSTPVVCHGDSNGTAAVTSLNPFSTISCLWSTGDTAASLTGLTAGSYSVTVSDLTCSKTFDVEVGTPPALAASLDSAANVRCHGESSGAISVTVAGGTVPYSYQWSNGAVSEDLADIPAGVYVLQVHDSVGCAAQLQETVNEPSTLDPLISGTSFTVSNVSCHGGSDGSVSLTVQGGVPPYLYQWSNGAVDSTVSNLPAGPIQVTIYDSNGCSAGTATTLSEPDPITPQVLALSAYNGLYNISCFGATDGEVDVSVVGGTPPYSFTWSNGTMSEDLMNVSAGAYDLTVVDSFGCTGQLTVTLSQPDELTVQLSSPVLSNGANIACNGGSTGSVFSSVFGGTPPYAYNWNPSGITSDSLTQLTAGYYLLDVTDFNGCQASSAITLSESPQLSLTMSSTADGCYADSSGSVSVTGVTGGTAPYSYHWDGLTSINSMVASLPAGTYAVTVTDQFGCTVSGTATITQPAQLVSSLTAALLPNGHHIACNGDHTGSIQSSVAGGTPPVAYVWSNGANTPGISGLPAGTYSLLVVDANGCTSNQTLVITQPEQLQATTSFSDPRCTGGATGTLHVDTVFGGTPPYSYAWSGTSSSSPDVQQLTAGSYSVTITDQSGCTDIRPFTLTDPPALLMGIDHVTDPLCHGGNNGELAFSVTGGTGSVQITLGNSTGSGPLFSGLSAGIYTAIATDQNGCTVTLQGTIADPPPVIADAGPDRVICEGNTAQLGAVIAAGQTGYWTTSDPAVSFENNAVPDVTVYGLPEGTSQLLWTVSDIHGCTDTASVIVLSYSGVFAEAGTDTVFCGDLGLLLEANLPDDMSGMWTSVNGAIFSDPFDPNAIVNIIHRGADTLQWTIMNSYCEKSDYLVVYSNDCGFDMPTGYSPNGDGKNDDFEIKGLYSYPDNYLRIFNRWGNLVFSYDDYTGHEWKGQNNAGDPLPDGTYFVLFVANGSDFRKATYVDIRR
jgi:gliding motility-associated-like protein/uncharacterized repeat protein (TIGR01451 family)